MSLAGQLKNWLIYAQCLLIWAHLEMWIIQTFQVFYNLFPVVLTPYGSDSRQTKTDPVGGVCSSDAKDAPVPNETAPVRAAEPLTNRIPLATTVTKEVLAECIKWKLGPSFDPLPFLSDPVVHSAFQQPDVLRLPERDWPRMAKAQVHCTRAELLKLAQKWDELGACRLVMLAMLLGLCLIAPKFVI